MPTLSILTVIIVMAIILIFSRDPGKLTETCGEGLCATNIYTGKKRCDTSVKYSPTFEVCNPPRSCTDNKTQYLYYSTDKGSEEKNAVCPDSIKEEDCKCMQIEYCPGNITTMFVKREINIGGQTVVRYVQTDNWTDDKNVTRATPPLSTFLPLGERALCSISAENLQNIWPNDTVNTRKCLRGTLRFFPDQDVYKCVI